jgi:hypothetical protein
MFDISTLPRGTGKKLNEDGVPRENAAGKERSLEAFDLD